MLIPGLLHLDAAALHGMWLTLCKSRNMGCLPEDHLFATNSIVFVYRKGVEFEKIMYLCS